MIFWTPEQLNIIQNEIASPWMILFAYYGSGKTWSLKERAKYLLKADKQHVVHFFLAKHRKDVDESLLDDLCMFFKNTGIQPKGLSVKFSYTNSQSYLSKELAEAGVQASHHVLIDEYTVIDPDDFVRSLNQLKEKVASLWIASTALNSAYDPTIFRHKVETQAGFLCPELPDIMRNSREIVHFTANLRRKRIYSCQQLRKEIKLKVEHPGLFHHFGQVFPNPMNALREAFVKHPKNKKCLVILTHANLHLKHFQGEFPSMIWKDFADKEQRKGWILTNKYEILLFIFINYYREKIRGIEVDAMIYIYPQCQHCQEFTIFPEMVTRAKVSLVLSSFQYCERCK